MDEEATLPNINPKPETFWQKQFSPEITFSQYFFDVLFGVIVPLLLLAFDPGVFIFAPFSLIRIFSYTAIGLGITVFIAWLVVGHKATIASAFIGTVFIVGAIFAALIGVVLSLLGGIAIASSIISLVTSLNTGDLVVLLLGLLGFVPWLTAFVYLRNAGRAFHLLNTGKSYPIFISVALGLLFILGIPFYTQRAATQYINSSMELILNGDTVESQTGIERLKKAFWCTDACYDEIVFAYNEEENEDRRLFLSRVYKEVTGNRIESRNWD